MDTTAAVRCSAFLINTVFHSIEASSAGRLGNVNQKMSNDMVKKRIEEEKKVVEQMIFLYCRKKEGNASLCPACQELLIYAKDRLNHCKFGNDKPTCKKCPVHCYRPDMKKRIKMVMRWSGPRMLFYHPISAVKHLLREL